MDATVFPTMMGYPSLPVSPPPDHRFLFNHPPTQGPTVRVTNPVLSRHFAREMEVPIVKKAQGLLEKHYQEQQHLRERHQAMARPQGLETQANSFPELCCSRPSTSASTLASSTTEPSSAEVKMAPQPMRTPRQPQQPHPRPQTQPHTQAHAQTHSQAHNSAPRPLPDNPFLNQPSLNLLDPSLTSDPKYAQMVARIAGYYQQRSQAILNFQQQRCQAWANAHRQKCQESMQAAMLVVAWYIRDRIGRRKRRNKRAFRHGLRNRAYHHNAAVAARRGGGGGGVGRSGGKGERVRKWVMEIPEGGGLASSAGLRDCEMLDKDEREFDVEKEVPMDKESQLFAVADRMIRSQLAKIDVPLLGALNLEDSDCESDSEDGGYYDPEDYDMEEDEEDEEDEDENDEDEYEYVKAVKQEKQTEACVESAASKEAMNGTGQGSLKRKHSESMG